MTVQVAKLRVKLLLPSHDQVLDCFSRSQTRETLNKPEFSVGLDTYYLCSAQTLFGTLQSTEQDRSWSIRFSAHGVQMYLSLGHEDDSSLAAHTQAGLGSVFRSLIKSSCTHFFKKTLRRYFKSFSK